MKRFACILLLLMGGMASFANTHTIKSPDGKLLVNVEEADGKLTYSVNYEGKQLLQPSLLGLKSDVGDYTQGLKVTDDRDKGLFKRV